MHAQRRILTLSLASLAGLSSAHAFAAVDCRSIPNTVLVTGSSAIKPLLAEIAKVLVVPQSSVDTGSAQPVTVLYAGAGSCVGVDAILNGTPVTNATLTYWDTMGAEQSCTLDPSLGGLNAAIGVSDVFASTCTPLPNGLPANVQDFTGPIQTMTFVVPHASLEDSISAEAAYYVFGFGSDSGVAPWTEEKYIFRRNDQSGTQRMIAKAIGVDASVWRGTATLSSSDLRQQVIAAGNQDAQATIGILAADEANANRATLNVLAYQHYGEDCAVYPDRDASSNEKENVRDGKYLIWGPLHLLTTVDNAQHASDSRARDIIGYITGTKAPPVGLDLIYLEAQRYVIPGCAMRVQRTQEMAPPVAFTPDQPCGCYYEKVSNGSTSCTPCTSDKDCTAANSVCSYQYCETL